MLPVLAWRNCLHAARSSMQEVCAADEFRSDLELKKRVIQMLDQGNGQQASVLRSTAQTLGVNLAPATERGG